MEFKVGGLLKLMRIACKQHPRYKAALRLTEKAIISMSADGKKVGLNNYCDDDLFTIIQPSFSNHHHFYLLLDRPKHPVKYMVINAS